MSYNGYQGHAASIIGLFDQNAQMAAGVAFIVHLGSPAVPAGFGGALPGRSVYPGGRLVPVIETLPQIERE